jgi:hypothetical protein
LTDSALVANAKAEHVTASHLIINYIAARSSILAEFGRVVRGCEVLCSVSVGLDSLLLTHWTAIALLVKLFTVKNAFAKSILGIKKDCVALLTIN